MKNNSIKIIIILLLSFIHAPKVISNDFTFNVTELIVTDNGNIYTGINGGTVKTENGIEITAETFTYNKLTSLLESKGNVILYDKIKDIKISSQKIFYLKNKELAYTSGESKATSGKEIEINSNEFFEYDKLNSILHAKGNVTIIDRVKNLTVESKEAYYFQKEDKFTTTSKTKANINNEYFVDTQDLVLLRKNMLLSSQFKTIITDTKDNFYKLNDFNYLINEKILKGSKIEIITNYLKKNSDKYFFNTAFINFNNQKFATKDVEINFYNEMFDEKENNPRLKGVSGIGDEFSTFLKKGSFTTCKKDDKCPPWLIEAENIKHDKVKRQIIYKDAWLKLYDIPVVYFPKFFHPYPTVIRQSGFLRPNLENSELLGSALNIPYFYVISDDKDMTLKPRIYDNDKYIFQSEYRQKTKNTVTIADFSYLKGYTSRIVGDTRDSRTHIFSNTIKELNFKNFLTSELEFQVQKTSNDTYLKAFNLSSPLLTGDNSVLETFVKLDLGHEDYDFRASIEQYETLSGKNSDRFQHILPSYNFVTSFDNKNFSGNFNFNSFGNNTLKSTNNIQSTITNDFNYRSLSHYSNSGIKRKYGIYAKNLNSIGKNDTQYKSSPQSELMSGYMFDLSLPLFKKNERTVSKLEPKLNLRFNPHDMKNHKNMNSRVDVANIYNFNRLGLSDSIETGASLTFGVDYKREEITKEDKDILDFFEVKIAAVLRAEEEEDIPTSSTINKKNSNILGAINYSSSENLTLNYDFSLDNNLDTLDYSSIDAEFTYNNFSTVVKFLEENGPVGKAHIMENEFRYNFDESNSFKFNTRRNKEINLTEYYDLIYEYKNDCLTASVEFKKRFYNNADIKPLEELYFSITIVPLGTFSPAPIIPKSVFNEDFKNIIQ